MDIFEIILLPFSWTLNSKIECPQRRYVFPKFNPCIQCIKNLDSAIISLNHVACYIGKCFNVLTHPPPVIIHLIYDGFFCSCKCELAATASKQTPFVPLLHTTHCRGDILPTMGEVCPGMTTKDSLYYHPLVGGFLITFKRITL